MGAALLLQLVPGLPLLLAAGLAWAPLRGQATALLPIAALPALAAALLLEEGARVEQPWFLLGSVLSLDESSRGFLLFTALLWLTAGAFAVPYLRNDPERASFAICALLAMAGNLGLLVARDVVTFYALFALMSFAAYGLVVDDRTAKAVFAGRVTLAMVVLGELALFAGFALAVEATGSTLLSELRAAATPEAAIWLLLIGFGVKLGVMPLHLWLPLAHAAAPVPASAVLSGAMIKAGLFGLLSVLPLGAAVLPAHGATLVVCGLGTVAFATLVGVTQTSPKAVLAYSSAGQMGLIAVALGVGLLAPGAWGVLAPVVGLYAAHHAFAKAALFLGVGVHAAHASWAWRVGTLGLLILPAAGLAAIPWTGGYEAKAGLKDAIGSAPSAWATWLPTAVALSSAATALLLARFAVTLSRSPASANGSRLAALPWVAAVACSLFATSALWENVYGVEGEFDLWSSSSLPLLGFLLAALGFAAFRAAGLRLRAVPPGEALALVERRAPPPAAAPAFRQPRIVPRARAWRRRWARAASRRAAARPPAWQAGGAAVILLLAAMLLLETAAAWGWMGRALTPTARPG